MTAERQGKRILVIDDDEDVRDFIHQALDAEGFQVSEARDGWQALSAAQESRPDLVILDVMLPGIDGEAVATALRIMEGVPILVITGREDAPEKRERLGGYAFLRKPFDLGQLLAAVEQGLAA